MTDRLYRSPTDKVIAGVAGGLAVWLNVDPSLVRIAWVLLAILSGGIFVLVYIVMMIVVPLPPAGWIPRPRGAAAWPAWSPGTPGAGAVPGWDPGTTPGTPPGTGAPDATQTGWTYAPGGTPQQPWVPPKVDTGGAGIIAGIVLVLLGVWFLVDQYVDVDWNLVWPVVVIALGAALIFGAIWRNRAPGS